MTVVPAKGIAFGVTASREAALVERARAMEPAAWDEIYEMHYPAIYRYCRYRIADVEAAEDLAADAFLEAVKGIRRYRYRGTPFRAWLYRIAHNLTVDERRRRAREAASATGIERVIDETADFADGVLDRRAIEVALDSLTEDQQQVIILRFLEGLPMRDVAVVMRRPVGAVKSLQHRAVSRLRELLEVEAG